MISGDALQAMQDSHSIVISRSNVSLCYFDGYVQAFFNHILTIPDQAGDIYSTLLSSLCNEATFCLVRAHFVDQLSEVAHHLPGECVSIMSTSAQQHSCGDSGCAAANAAVT